LTALIPASILAIAELLSWRFAWSHRWFTDLTGDSLISQVIHCVSRNYLELFLSAINGFQIPGRHRPRRFDFIASPRARQLRP